MIGTGFCLSVRRSRIFCILWTGIMIEFNNVCKTYDNGTKALQNVTINIDKGEFVFIVGASGAGKSTLLKTIMREEVVTSGSVVINGFDLNTMPRRKIPYFRRKLGIVFQDFRLIPNMTAYNNVAFAMRVTGARERDISRRVAYALSLVGLSTKANMYPTELSGGEQQRVALARALVNYADIIIADEPTGNVDPKMSREIVELLTRINDNGTTVLMVTHEHELVKLFNKRVITIKNGRVISDSLHPEVAENAVENADEDETETAMSGFYQAPGENSDIDEFISNYAKHVGPSGEDDSVFVDRSGDDEDETDDEDTHDAPAGKKGHARDTSSSKKGGEAE